jgi:(heptosyl)LPS beta-1,4-glucosyltransferase
MDMAPSAHVMNTERVNVSVVVITKNEEHNIRECLESVRWADEIVVVDAKSTDRTVEIAKIYTDKIFVRPWPGFGPQKNFGMDQTESDWILVLDADERVTSELQQEIQEVVKQCSGHDPVAYRIPRRNFYYGRWISHGGVYPDYQVRLVRRGTARYNDVPVHENLIVDGTVAALHGHLDHYTEGQIADHFKKFGLYTTLAAQQKLKSRKCVHWYDLLGRPLVIFLKTYVIKQGFRDRVHGLIVSVFASMYSFVKYAKLWELLNVKRGE